MPTNLKRGVVLPFEIGVVSGARHVLGKHLRLDLPVAGPVVLIPLSVIQPGQHFGLEDAVRDPRYVPFGFPSVDQRCPSRLSANLILSLFDGDLLNVRKIGHHFWEPIAIGGKNQRARKSDGSINLDFHACGLALNDAGLKLSAAFAADWELGPGTLQPRTGSSQVSIAPFEGPGCTPSVGQHGLVGRSGIFSMHSWSGGPGRCCAGCGAVAETGGGGSLDRFSDLRLMDEACPIVDRVGLAGLERRGGRRFLFFPSARPEPHPQVGDHFLAQAPIDPSNDVLSEERHLGEPGALIQLQNQYPAPKKNGFGVGGEWGPNVSEGAEHFECNALFGPRRAPFSPREEPFHEVGDQHRLGSPGHDVGGYTHLALREKQQLAKVRLPMPASTGTFAGGRIPSFGMPFKGTMPRWISLMVSMLALVALTSSGAYVLARWYAWDGAVSLLGTVLKGSLYAVAVCAGYAILVGIYHTILSVTGLDRPRV